MTNRCLADEAWYWESLHEYSECASEPVYATHICDERHERAESEDLFGVYQDVWAVSRVLTRRPPWMLDVGGTARYVGMLSLFLPVTFVDIRPSALRLNRLTFVRGDVTALPFEDDSVPMASCLSVIEHIGLGRYGDAIDPNGAEHACGELQRVVEPGGCLLVSAPVGERVQTHFNMHRLLTPKQIAAWLPACDLIDGAEIRGERLRVWCAEFEKRRR